jgi:hypothetical protein
VTCANLTPVGAESGPQYPQYFKRRSGIRARQDVVDDGDPKHSRGCLGRVSDRLV